MLKALRTTLAAAGLAVALTGVAQASPGALAGFDARAADSWADKLVLCDVTAFLAGKPNMNADIMWVRRDDSHPEMLLPPNFVAQGAWYKEGYQRLYWKLRRTGSVSRDQIYASQDGVGQDFVKAYRRSWGIGDSRFLRQQDSYCRTLARAQGVIVF